MAAGAHRLGLALGPRLLLATLEAWFRRRRGWQVVGTLSVPAAALDLVVEAEPQLLLLGLATPSAAGLEATRRIREQHPATEVVLLAARHNQAYPPQAFEAGARGYLTWACSVETVETALRAALRGDYFLAGEKGEEEPVHEVLDPVVSRLRPGGRITPRERQLACLLADGYSSREAARVMNISVKTAETHRASLMRKLDAHNVADVVRYCIRNRLIQA